MAKIGKQLTAYTASADGDVIPPNDGFMVNLDGTFSFRPRANSAAEAVPVKAGVVYPIDVYTGDLTTGSVTVTKFWIIEGQNQ